MKDGAQGPQRFVLSWVNSDLTDSWGPKKPGSAGGTATQRSMHLLLLRGSHRQSTLTLFYG